MASEEESLIDKKEWRVCCFGSALRGGGRVMGVRLLTVRDLPVFLVFLLGKGLFCCSCSCGRGKKGTAKGFKLNFSPIGLPDNSSSGVREGMGDGFVVVLEVFATKADSQEMRLAGRD